MSWPAYGLPPPVDRIVRLDMMNHMLAPNEAERLPGGMFGVIEAKYDATGDVLVITMPESLLDHPRYGDWVWTDPFPFSTLAEDPDYMVLLAVPDDVDCAMRALLAMHDTFPIVVDDGFLC